MIKILVTSSISLILSIGVLAQSGDWGEEESEGFQNSTFEKMKIKNRSKKTYDDKIYKYIKGDYTVENNEIELATIELDDNLKSRDLKVNVLVEDLVVEGDDTQEPISIRRNRYKNYTKHDRREDDFFDKDEQEFEKFTGIETSREERINTNSLDTSSIMSRDPLYEENNDSDISQIERIDLRGNSEIKEVNVFIEDTRIRVDD